MQQHVAGAVDLGREIVGAAVVGVQFDHQTAMRLFDCFGIGAGGEAATTPYLLTRYFGLRSFSTLYGLTWTFYAAAGATGPVILGRAFDLTGSYTSLLTVLAAALAIAALLNLFLPRYSTSSAIVRR